MGMTAQFKILDDSELEKVLSAPDDIEDFLFPEEEDDPFEGQTDLDKSWHALHYLICGKLEPDGSVLGEAILGGQVLGPDLGYGQARIIGAKKVQEISKSLSSVDIEAAYSSLDQDSDELKEVYIGFEFFPEELEDYKYYFASLKNMYSEASERCSAVLAYLA